MGTNAKLVAALNRTLQLAGTPLRIRYYDTVYDNVYDEATDLLQSGNSLWISGVVFPIHGREGSQESVLMSQGKLIDSDKTLFVNGSIDFNSASQSVDIQLGSPTGNLYTTIPDGGIVYETEATPVYKKQYIRKLTGSLING